MLLTRVEGLVRTTDSLLSALLLGFTLREVDLVTVLDLVLLLSGVVLTTLLEPDEELRGALLITAFERDEELRGVVTTALDFVEELLDEDRTAELLRFTGELFLELLLRTEVVLDLLLFDPDLRCASAPMGAASIAISIMMTYFFMISTVYTSIQTLQLHPCKFFAKPQKSLYNHVSEVSEKLIQSRV